MTEQKDSKELTGELAQYFEDRKGDTSLWEKNPRTIRRRRGQGPSTSFAVRFAPDELELVQKTASAKNTTVSDFIRQAALKATGVEVDQAANPLDCELLASLKRLLDAVKETEKVAEKVLKKDG